MEHISDKEVAALARQAKDQGWSVAQTPGDHIAFTSPDGERLVTSKTPSDHRSLANHTARMRKAGYRPGAPNSRRKSQAREERMRQARLQTGVEKVLAALQELEGGDPVTPTQLGEITGLPQGNVSVAIHTLQKTHPEIHRVARGQWTYRRQETETKDEPFVLEEEFAPYFSDEPLPTNGNGKLTALTLDAPEIDFDFAVQQDRHPIVFRAAVADEQPSMFEAVTADRQGRPVLRDENGDLWVAVPLRAAL